MRKTLYVAMAAFLVAMTAQAVDFDTRACLNPQNEVFFSAMQRFVTMKNKTHGDRMDKTKYKPTSLALGWQYSTEQLTAGVSTSYEIGKIKYYDDGDFAKVRDRMFGFTLFGEYRFGCGYYTKGSAFVGFASQKLKSGHDDTGLTFSSGGSTSSTRFGASLEFGKVFEIGDGFRVTPHVGFDYARYTGKNIPYSDISGDYAISQPSQNLYEFPIGVKLAKDFQYCDWVVTPSVDVTLVTSVGGIKNHNMNARPGFASRTGSEWKVYGITGDHWGGRITTGVKAVKAGRFDVDVNYAYEGRKKYNDHRLSATVGLGF